MSFARTFAAVWAASVFAGALGGGTLAARAEDTIKIAVGQRGNWDTSPAEVGQQAGIFKKHGIVLEILYTQGSGETQQAVISNSANIGVAVGTSGALSAFSKGAPLRPISNSTTGADDLFWYVRADSPIKTVKDGAGKTISYSTGGSSTNLAVNTFIKYYDVAMKPTAVGGPAASFAQTMSGQVDIGWSSAPFGVKDMREGKIRLLIRMSDVPAFKNQTVRMNVSNLTFIEQNPDVLKRFRDAYKETLDFMYTDPKAIEIWSKWTGVPVELATSMRDEFFPRKNLQLDRVSGLEEAMADAQAMKFISAPLTKPQLDDFLKYYYKP
jgi:NitT/TauT family transport system substrate-binding protein